MKQLLQEHVVGALEGLARSFRSAAPFPHIVIDGFLRDDVVETLLTEFPEFERGDCRDENGVPGRKSTFEAVRELGPGFAAIDTLVRGTEFLSFLGRLTGIDGLLYDPHYVGGGTHENRARQELDPHVDFNYHPTTGWHRRLNLLLYLNRDWSEPWGGCLELHSDPWRPSDDCVTTILPLRNRCVVFETSERSWHGFLPILPPAERPALSRRSLALYFYTRERPPAETAPAHATVYVERPLPPVAADTPLGQPEVAELLTRIERRDGHLDRLQRREQLLARQLRELLATKLIPGAPAHPGVLEAIARLGRNQEEGLQSLYRREKEFAALLALLRSSVRTPFSLAEQLTLASPARGCWEDGWVGRQLRLSLVSARDASGFVLKGSLPREAGPERELSLKAGTSTVTLSIGVGNFEWPIALPLRPGAASEAEIVASAGFCPRASGLSDDGRELCWLLREIRLSPA